MSSDPDNELRDLIRAVREHLRWESELGSQGLPELDGEALAHAAAEVARAELVVAGAAEMPVVAPPRGPVEPGERRTRLQQIEAEVRGCTQCGLHAGRTQTVFARGNPDASLMFVGEGPGAQEDLKGQPFVGPAGQLLDKMIGAMGFSQDEVYICNVVKCRPPDNRTPSPEESAACLPFLRQQLSIVEPRTIVALGRCAAETLGVARTGQPWRGVWGSYEGVPVMPTYHPAYLLRSPEQKRPVWEDLQSVVTALGRTLPSSRR